MNAMLKNQIKLVQGLSCLGTYRTQCPEPPAQFLQPHGSLSRERSSASACCSMSFDYCSWAATAADVGSAYVHCC